MVEKKKTRSVFDTLLPAGIQALCPKCGHQGFIALHNDAVVNAEKTIAIIACSSCYTAIGVLPAQAVWDDLD